MFVLHLSMIWIPCSPPGASDFRKCESHSFSFDSPLNKSGVTNNLT